MRFFKTNNNPIRRGLIWNSLSNFCKYGLTFVGTMVLARLLSPEDYGLIGIISVFIAVADVLVSGGLGGAVVKKTDAKEIDFSTLTTYNIGVSVLLYLLFFLLAPVIARFYSEPILESLIRLYALVVLIHALSIAPHVKLMKQLRFKTLSIMNLVGGVVSLLFAVLLAHKGYGVYSLVGQYVMHALLVSVLYWVVSKYKIRIAFSKSSFKEQFSFGMYTTLASMLKSLSENIVGNIIAKSASITQTGYYTQSNRLVHVPQNFFYSVVDSTLFPVLSQMENKQQFSKKIKTLNEKTNVAIFFAFGGAVVCCKELVYILLGEKWMAAEWSLTVLLYAATFICLGNFGRNTLKCLGYTRKILVTEVYAFILMMALLLIGYMTKDYKVILLGYLLCHICKSLYFNYLSGKCTGFPFRELMEMMAKMIIPVAILILTIKQLDLFSDLLLNGLTKAALYVALSAVSLWVMKKLKLINI